MTICLDVVWNSLLIKESKNGGKFESVENETKGFARSLDITVHKTLGQYFRDMKLCKYCIYFLEHTGYIMRTVHQHYVYIVYNNIPECSHEILSVSVNSIYKDSIQCGALL